jgi:hypothetical protein
MVLAKLSRLTPGKRLGICFPETHNFAKFIGPLIGVLLKNGIDVFLVSAFGIVTHFGEQPLPPALPSGQVTKLLQQ